MAKSRLVRINKKIETAVVSGYKRLEKAVVNAYRKIENKFVDSFLTKDGETVGEPRQD